MKMRAESHDLGESFMQAVVGSDAQHVDEKLKSWAEANRDELHAPFVAALKPYTEYWRDYEEQKGTDVVARAFDSLRAKVDRNKYQLVLQLSTDYLRDEKRNPIPRYPTPEPEPAPEPEPQPDPKPVSGGYGVSGGYSRATGPSPNDNRSNTLNPNNPASGAAASNRSNQMNPSNPAFRSSGGGRGGRRR